MPLCCPLAKDGEGLQESKPLKRFLSGFFVQGTAAVALAGLIAALPLTGGTLADHKFLFFGAGEVCPFPPCCTLKPHPKKMFQCNFFVTTNLQVCFLCQLTQFRVSCNAGWNRYCRDYCIGNQQAGEAYIGRSKEEDLSCGLQGNWVLPLFFPESFFCRVLGRFSIAKWFLSHFYLCHSSRGLFISLSVCVGGGQGLVTKSRYDSLQEFKKLYAHEHEPCSNLVSAIKV